MWRPARVALVGDRSATVRAHQRIPGLLAALRDRHGLPVDGYWVPTPDAEPPGAVGGFDAVWLLPGSPYRSEAGALAAVRTAREDGIPFLGTCGGFQHALLEFARNVCGLTAARHAENDPEGDPDDVLIARLSCSLAGREGRLRTTPGTLAERILGSRETVERFHCAYGPVPGPLPELEAAGLLFTAHDPDGEPRVAELPGHPFFLATLFQPELSGDGTVPHPFVRALAEAATRRAAAHATATESWDPGNRLARFGGGRADFADGPGRQEPVRPGRRREVRAGGAGAAVPHGAGAKGG
jgi:CTP synthase (UTP-ammonia lyase)